jgi:hypothetical protein
VGLSACSLWGATARLLDCHQGSHEGEGLQEEDDDHEEEQEVDILEEVDHPLAITIDED